MKTAFSVILCLCAVQFINAKFLNLDQKTVQNVTVTNTTTEITNTTTVRQFANKPANISMVSEGKRLASGVQVNIGDRFNLAGLSSSLGKVEKIVVRQLLGVVTVVLRLVTGTVYEVVEIVPRLLNVLTPGVFTTLSLVDDIGEFVVLDVKNVRTLSLNTLDNVRRTPVTLVLQIN